MALPTKILAGYSAALYIQPSSTPTALTNAQLATLASITAIAITGNLLNVEAIPAFGQE